MRRSRLFIGMPVISLEEGHQVGEIKGLVINPALKNVAALIIEPKGFFREQKFIPFSKVHNIGDDVVTIDRVSRAERGISLPEILGLIKDRIHIIGSRMVTEGGTNLGVVDEYYIDLLSGDIAGLEFSGGAVSNLFKGSAYLDIEHIKTIGSSVIICSNTALESAEKIDGGLKETFRSFSENTSHILGNTFQKTKSWGRSLNNTISQSIKKLKKDKKTDLPQEGTNKEKNIEQHIVTEFEQSEPIEKIIDGEITQEPAPLDNDDEQKAQPVDNNKNI